MLSAVDPGNQGRDVTVAQVLSQAARDVEGRSLDPEVEAEIRHTIGQTYYGLGLYDSALVHAERAVALRRRTFGDRDPRTVASQSYIVALAEARGSFAQAESLARVVVDLRRAMPQPRPADLASALDDLARVIEHQGRLDESYRIKLEAIGIRRGATDSASRGGLPMALNALAVSNMYQGRFAAAESLMREALAAEAEVRSASGPNYGEGLRGLAAVLEELGRLPEADSVMRESVRILRATVGPEHTSYLRSLHALASLRYSAGDMAGAAGAAREVVSRIGTSLPEGDQSASAALQVLGLALDSLKQHEDGGRQLERSLEIRRKYLPPDHWAIASSEAMVGHHLLLVRRFEESEQMLLGAYRKLAAARGADADITRRTANRLAQLYGATGRRADSVSWSARGR
jgi:tetratricopeptide (TPR) repeat protein